MLQVGDLIPGAPGRATVALPFQGRHTQEMIFEQTDTCALIVGIVPTVKAARWADQHRRLHCEYYEACLDAAADAQRNGHGTVAASMTWVCDECDR